MESIKVIARKWGNSFGFVLPKKVIDEKKIEEGTKISVTIEPFNKMTAGDIMELARKHPLPKKIANLQKELDEIDKELWPEDE